MGFIQGSAAVMPMSFFTRPIQFSFLALALVALGACEEEKVAVEKPVRAIKSMVVKERAGDQIRRIAGLTESSIVTDLAFQVGGRITTMKTEVGERVAKGAVIASLDSEPFRLRNRTANGKVTDADAKLKDAEAKYKQQSTLYKQGFATKTAYDTALSSFNSAKSNLDVANAEAELAERDMRLTTLTAPINGSVTGKYVERFAEVSAGQKIVQVSADGGLKVKVSVPEGMVRRIGVKDPVDVSFPTLQGRIETGKITEIGASAGSTNSFPVTVVLDNPEAPDLQPGLTSEVWFKYKTEATGKAFLLPVTAVLPTEAQNAAIVFVYDKSAGVVNQKAVNVVNVRDNELEIIGEVKAGDIVATAGVSFLVDGMKVKLLEPAQAE